MSLSDARLRSFNHARLHFKYYSLADIYSGDGTILRKSALESTSVYETSNYEWPVTKPCKGDYIIWRTILQEVHKYYLNRGRKLGKWMPNTHTSVNCLKHVIKT